jgi:hypothetical protein
MSLLTHAIELISTTGGELLQHMGLSNPGPAFPKFLELPTELRRQIWRAAFPPSRVIELIDGPGRTGRLRAQQLVTPWITPARPPPILYVCRESRDEALRYYQLAFGRNGFEPRIYIDFTREIVYFGRGTRGDGTVDVDDFMRDFEKVRYMAVTFNSMAQLLDVTVGRRFTGLKEIYLVNLRTYGMRVPPQLERIPSGSLGQAVASYSQKLEQQKDRFNGGIAPRLNVAIFVS